MTWQHSLLLFTASMLAGAVNSVAGGGTLLTFPALVYCGQAALLANATSTVALWPGQLSSLWGYRKEIGQTRAAIVPLTVLGVIGGVAGAWMLLVTSKSTFDKLVPFLVLLATSLFMAQEPLSRRQRARLAQAKAVKEAVSTPPPAVQVSDTIAKVYTAGNSLPSDSPERLPVDSAAPATGDGSSPVPADSSSDVVFGRLTLPVALLSLGIAVYGGYFGAGIGILTLAALGFLGFTNIHQMNGVKNIFTLCINGVAALIFVFKGLVDWRVSALMAVGAIFGGYAGAGIARRIGQKNVRLVVIGLGLVLTLSLLKQSWWPKSHSENANAHLAVP